MTTIVFTKIVVGYGANYAPGTYCFFNMKTKRVFLLGDVKWN